MLLLLLVVLQIYTPWLGFPRMLSLPVVLSNCLKPMVDANPSMKLLGGWVPILVLPFTGYQPENDVKVKKERVQISY
jgi:hypothetical protein